MKIRAGYDIAFQCPHAVPMVFMLTTHPSREVRRRAALAGATLIEKPLLNDTLFLGIRAALDGQGGVARPTS